MKNEPLDWPLEAAWAGKADDLCWNDGGPNQVLDFHGDPRRARLTVFSDGNHHMALEQCVQAFLGEHPAVEDVFYVTLPPGVFTPLLGRSALRLGNLRLQLAPDLMLGPRPVLEPFIATGRVKDVHAFARSLGNVLLVRRGNPKAIRGVTDLYRDDVRLFISNPLSEKASHDVYRDTLCSLARAAGLDDAALRAALTTPSRQVIHGRKVHHREAPAAVAQGRADAAVVYHHLALRYTRIFPERFERVPLPGSGTEVNAAEQVSTEYHVGLVDGGGRWGPAFHHFLTGGQGAAIYRSHGLGTPGP